MSLKQYVTYTHNIYWPGYIPALISSGSDGSVGHWGTAEHLYSVHAEASQGAYVEGLVSSPELGAIGESHSWC